MSFRKDNRGVALVYMIVAVSMIILLGATTMTVAYANLEAAKVQAYADENFYDAESVIDAIVGTVESDMSTAYTHTMNKISDLDDSTDYNSKKLDELFDQYFTSYLSHLLNNEEDNESAEPSQQYSMQRIIDGVESVFPNNIMYSISSANGENTIDVVKTKVENTDGSTDEYYDYTLYLRNIHATYEDDSGYFDEITTDIQIDPPVYSSLSAEKSPVGKAAGLVADEGLEVEASNVLSVYGNIYLNEIDQQDVLSAKSYDANYSSKEGNVILVGNGASLSVQSSYETVAGGDIEVKDNSSFTYSSLNSDSTADLWTENIALGQYGTILLNGQIYVEDDLEMNGTDGEVTLVGSYFGYSGTQSDAGTSSAININGTNSVLDLSGLSNLVLAGTSHVDFSNKANETSIIDEKSKAIVTGEAISLRSNQLAYLVNPIDYKIETESKIEFSFTNPMKTSELNRLNASIQAIEGDETFTSLLNAAIIRTWGPQYQLSIKSEQGLSDSDPSVFLYITVSADLKDSEEITNAASVLYQKVINGESTTARLIRYYSAQYIKSLSVNSATTVYANGNYISQEKLSSGEDTTTVYTALLLPTLLDFDDGISNGLDYEARFKADSTTEEYYTKLISNLSQHYNKNGTVTAADKNDTETKKYEVTFEKLINETMMKQFITDAKKSDSVGLDGAVIDTSMSSSGNGDIVTITSNGLTAYIVDNENKNRFDIPEGSGIVIATGDVRITGNWKGTIITKGRIYQTTDNSDFYTDYTVTWDIGTVNKTSQIRFSTADSKYYMVKNIFNNYTDESAETNDDETDSVLSACVSFKNWNRY